jgi:cytochrome b pre-mRNA-processing protein 3
MFGWLERKARLRRTGRQLYESIVARARAEVFYRDLGVADTIEGRFEMIVLHMVLVLQRLKREGEPGQRLGQIAMEHLFADMDDALRQIGIGDMGVPRRVQRAAAALAERSLAYSAAIPGGDLEAALLLHVYGATEAIRPHERALDAQRLADYVRASAGVLDATPGETLVAGSVTFAEMTPQRP